MRLNAVPENLFERIALRAGVVPTPLGDTIVAMTLARTIMVATKLGVFEALAKAEGTAHDLALRCGLDPRATEALLFALAGADYVQSKGMRYALAPIARKWLLKSSPRSLYDYMLFNFMNWTWDERFEDFLRTGEPAHIHQGMSQDEWQVYQRAMRSLAGFSAFEVARRMPVPRGALDMLDLGGSHGYYSVMLCRLHPGLRSVVFDLPEAVVHASKILAQEGMGERIVHRAGNVLTDVVSLILLEDMLDAVRVVDQVSRPEEEAQSNYVSVLVGHGQAKMEGIALYLACISQQEMSTWTRRNLVTV